MRRINEFESLLTERISRIENTEIKISDFERFLSGDGEIRYTYLSTLLGAEITATYKGSRYYGHDAIIIKLNVSFDNYK